MDLYEPDWKTEASMPAYAKSFTPLLKRLISPTAPSMVSPMTLPMPGIVVIGVCIFQEVPTFLPPIRYLFFNEKL